MTADEFRLLIESGDAEGVRQALARDPGPASRPIRWFLNQENHTDPLHYVSDCVANGWLTNGTEGDLAALLLTHGATITGSEGRESPLIGSASLGVERVTRVLVDAGADLEATSVMGARALHWAAWVGTPATAHLLVARGADIEARCSEFGATPLFWAVHGYGPNGPKPKTEQVGVARVLIQAGARVDTANKQGLSALDLSQQCKRGDMHDVLRQSLSSAAPQVQ